MNDRQETMLEFYERMYEETQDVNYSTMADRIRPVKAVGVANYLIDPTASEET